MNKIKISLVTLAVAVCSLVLTPGLAFGASSAASGASSAASSGVDCPADLPNRELICGTSGGGEQKLMDTVGNVLNVIYGMIGIVAVVMIVVGGVKYMTSQGDPGKIQSAKNTILYSVIGLVITLSAFAITNFILSALK